MMWDRVIERLLVIIAEDGILSSEFGDRIRMAGSGAAPSPRDSLLEYTHIADSEGELWAPCVFQFDIWAPQMARVTVAERRLRQLFNPPLPTDYGGVMMFAQYVDGTMLASPDRNGFSGRGIRFRFTPLRERYAGLAPTE